jgi:hypothetical protein
VALDEDESVDLFLKETIDRGKQNGKGIIDQDTSYY